MRQRWVVLGLIALVMLLVAGAAVADTGGSMGGGSWGGGGGGGGGYSGGGGGYSGGGGGYSGGGGGYSGGGGGWSSGGGGGGGNYTAIDCSNMGPGGLFAILAILVIVVFLKVSLDSMSSGSNYSQLNFVPMPYTNATVDVTVLRVAVDGRARKFVQTELLRIAKVADTKTEDGRAKMLSEVSMMLRKLRDAWVYGGAINEAMRDIGGAKGVFDRHVDDARSRFREEVIRNADGTTQTRAASEYSPRGDEGAGLILVSIIVAARRELFTVQRIGDGDDLRRALEGASQLTPNHLVAIEIVWQPAEETDRLSSMELEAKYPRPELIPIKNALVGKAFCTYCTGPFPGELVSCPHCGAPAPGRTEQAA